jgi:hypothetical protein
MIANTQPHCAIVTTSERCRLSWRSLRLFLATFAIKGFSSCQDQTRLSSRLKPLIAKVAKKSRKDR